MGQARLAVHSKSRWSCFSGGVGSLPHPSALLRSSATSSPAAATATALSVPPCPALLQWAQRKPLYSSPSPPPSTLDRERSWGGLADDEADEHDGGGETLLLALLVYGAILLRHEVHKTLAYHSLHAVHPPHRCAPPPHSTDSTPLPSLAATPSRLVQCRLRACQTMQMRVLRRAPPPSPKGPAPSPRSTWLSWSWLPRWRVGTAPTTCRMRQSRHLGRRRRRQRRRECMG